METSDLVIYSLAVILITAILCCLIFQGLKYLAKSEDRKDNNEGTLPRFERRHLIKTTPESEVAAASKGSPPSSKKHETLSPSQTAAENFFDFEESPPSYTSATTRSLSHSNPAPPPPPQVSCHEIIIEPISTTPERTATPPFASTKTRSFSNPPPPPPPPIPSHEIAIEPISTTIQTNKIAPLVSLLESENINIQKRATETLRNIAANSSTQDKNAIIQAGVLPHLVQFLTSVELRGIAIETLEKLSAGDSYANKQAIIDAGAIPLLIEWINSYEIPTCTASLNSLSNIFDGTVEQCQAILNAGLIAALQQLLQSRDIRTFEVFVETEKKLIANLRRESILKALKPLLTKLLFWAANPEIRKFADEMFEKLAAEEADYFKKVDIRRRIKALKSLLVDLQFGEESSIEATLAKIAHHTVDQEGKEAIFQAGVLPFFVKFLIDSPEMENRLISAQALANLTSDTVHHQNQWVLDAGAIPPLLDSLHSINNEIAIAASRALANLLNGTPQQVQQIHDANLAQNLIDLFNSRDEKQCEIAANLVSTASILDENLILSIVKLLDLSTTTPEICKLACQTLIALSAEKENDKNFNYKGKQAIIEARALPSFVKLLQFDDGKICKLSAQFFSNISMGTVMQVQAIIDSHAEIALIKLLENSHSEICYFILHTLGNIACDTGGPNQSIIDAGCNEALIKLLNSPDKQIATKATEILMNLACGNSRQYQKILNFVITMPHLCPPKRVLQILYATVTNDIKDIIKSGAISYLMKILNTEDDEICEDVLHILKLISDGTSEDKQAIIQVIPSLNLFLNSGNPRMHWMTLQILNNLIHGTLEQRSTAFKSINILQIFQMLENKNTEIVEFAVEILGKFLTNPSEDIGAKNDILEQLFMNLHKPELTESSTKILEHLNNEAPEIFMGKNVLPSLQKILESENENLLLFVTSQIAKVSGGDNDEKQIIIDCGFLPPMANLLKKSINDQIYVQILTTFKNISNGTNEQKNALIEADTIEISLSFMHPSNAILCLLASKILENIFCSNSNSDLRISAINVVTVVAIQFLDSSNLEISNSVTKILNGICSGKKEHIEVVINAGAVPFLQKLLKSPDPEVATIASDTLCKIFFIKNY